MADNVAITAGSGTTVATDDIGGVHFPRAKLSLGPDGTANDAVAGAGAVGVGVQRVTLASDDPAVVALQLLDDAIFAEDVAATAADKGIAILAVRRDADTALVGTDNDYANLQVNATGALKVVDTTLDDWDESDRAKVNLIVGQAGIAGGQGSAGATTVRVTLASDSPGVAAASGLTYGQNALSTTQEQVLASNSSRIFAEVKNLDSSITVYIGDDTSVTSSNGHALKAGEAFVFEGYTGAIHAIAASGTPTVSYVEW
jgi:hypothetical protein